jgi:hypothetical protein
MSILLAIALAATDAQAEAPAPPPAPEAVVAEALPRWRLAVSALTARPAVLPGLSLGATAEVGRRVELFPGFVFARFGYTASSAENVAWVISHDQYLLAAGAGVATTVGAGRFWAQAGLGLSGLYEVLSRHQRQRIDAAGVSGGSETTFTVGPYAFAEGGLTVELRGHASGFFAAGPVLTRTPVNDSTAWRLGGSARLGVSYGF